MSEIDYQALREAAENATPGEWCTDDHYGVIADAGLNANYYIASCSGPDNRSNKRFIAAANPATVLALLDEINALEETRINDVCRIAELTKQLESAKSKLNEQREYYEGVISDGSKRIAELEAREISLPERSSMLYRTFFHEDYHTVMAYKVSDVIAAIRAAGIRIKGE